MLLFDKLEKQIATLAELRSPARIVDCPECGGTGEIEVLYSDRQSGFRYNDARAGDVHHTETCQRCNGAKLIEVEP